MLLTVPLMEIGDFPMSRRELLGIRRRAEAMAAARRARPETVDAIPDATHEAKHVMTASWPIGVPSRSTAVEAVDDTTYPRVAAALP